MLKIIILILSVTLFSYSKSNIVLISLDNIMIPVIYTQHNTSVLESFKQKYLDAINVARSQTQDCGEYGIKPAVAPLRWNENLYISAKNHSNDMAQSDTFSHTGSGELTDLVATENHPGEGSTIDERIEYAGYTSWSIYGENIAAGHLTVEDVMQGWLDSPGHCDNIMDPHFQEVGMSLIQNTNSSFHTYWTQDFGAK